jgi:hypothetical protein
MPTLYHRSNSNLQIGTHLVPLNRDNGNALGNSYIWFDERLDWARKWNSCPLVGYQIYSIDSSAITNLEPHPQWEHAWQTQDPIPFSALTLVESREDPETLPNLEADVNARISELGL